MHNIEKCGKIFKVCLAIFQHYAEHHDGGPYHIENNRLIETNRFVCFANQWTGSCMIASDLRHERVKVLTTMVDLFIIKPLWLPYREGKDNSPNSPFKIRKLTCHL